MHLPPTKNYENSFNNLQGANKNSEKKNQEKKGHTEEKHIAKCKTCVDTTTAPPPGAALDLPPSPGVC